MPRTARTGSDAPKRSTKSKKATDRRRKKRPRPTPKLLTRDDDLDELGKRRCLMVLSVLSGQRPVTDVIEEHQISRQTYYHLEIKAIQGMLRALGSSHGSLESELSQLRADNDSLRAQTARLETKNRRLEHLLMLTRKVVKTGPMTLAKRGRPRKVRAQSSASAGTSASSSSRTASETTTESPSSTSSPTKTSTDGR